MTIYGWKMEWELKGESKARVRKRNSKSEKGARCGSFLTHSSENGKFWMELQLIKMKPRRSNFLKLENHTHLKKVVSRKFESFFRQKINRPQGSFGLSWLD